MNLTENRGTWTEEQWAAIQSSGEVLVAAAAGSGKTAVLIERILRRITDPLNPVDINQFLVVTFTNAAAQEMRERMRSALEKQLFEREGTEAENLMRQLSLLSQAHITTLHSFCLELLRQYFYLLDLDPTFRVADEAEAHLLRQDVLADLFDCRYEEEDQVFLKLVDCLGSDRDDRGLAEQLLKIYFFAYSQSDPKQWLGFLASAYQWDDLADLLESPWGMIIRSGADEELKQITDLLNQARTCCLAASGPIHYLPAIDSDLEQLSCLTALLNPRSWKEWEEGLAAFSFVSLPRGKGKQGIDDPAMEEDLREKVKGLREQAKKQLVGLKKVFAFPLEKQLPFLNEMLPLVRRLSSLTLEFAQAYETEKRRRNIVDFTDMEHLTLKLLASEGKPTAIAENFSRQFREVLVDEYQDINPAQEYILRLLSPRAGQGSFFMVGDVKQSIYRFRMADPTLFLDKYNQYPHWEQGTEKWRQEGLVIDLARNFRSRREIVTGINAVFAQIMIPSVGEILYDEQAALQYGASYPESGGDQTGGPVEVHLVDHSNLSENEQREEEEDEGAAPNDGEADNPAGMQKEARLVARQIRYLVEEEKTLVFDKAKGDYRPAGYRDIVVLMRSYASVAQIFAEEFQKAQIPVYTSAKQGYFAASEVEIILALLQVIDNPRLDISLASVLRSPIVGLSGEELGYIRTLLPHGDYYEALSLLVWENLGGFSLDASLQDEFQSILLPYENNLQDLAEKSRALLEEFPQLGEKCARFWTNLQAWRTHARRFSLAELIWRLYQDTGYLSYVGTLTGGEKRQANLKLLYDRACRFESTHYRGLFRFLRFIDKFKEQAQDWGEARTLTENEDVVRFLTVHGSKGLEFPIVFVVGLGRTFNTRNLQDTLLLHSRLGLGMPNIDLEHRIHYPSCIQQAVRQQLSKEGKAEEMRILYVALTRAKEQLFLYGTVKNLTKKWEVWQQSDPDPLGLDKAKSFLDWIGPVAARQDELSFCRVELHKEISSQRNDERDPLTAMEEEDIPEEGIDFWRQAVNDRLNWQYPYQREVDLPAKTSVSELKRKLIWYTDETTVPFPPSVSNKPALVTPYFLQENMALSPAEEGTALHTLLQHLPFSAWGPEWDTLSEEAKGEKLESQVQLLMEKNLLTSDQGKSIKISSLLNMLNSDTGRRIFNSSELRKEVPFTLFLTPLQESHPILVQGIIDLVLIDHKEKSLEIIDYKTDHLPPDSRGEEILQKRYALQLGIYTLACERLLKWPVATSSVYAFSLEKEVVISRVRWETEMSRRFML